MTDNTETAVKLSFAEWRKANQPRLRRTAPVGIVVNTSRRRVYECLCGARETCCNDYPPTRRVLDFIDRHNESCMPDVCKPR